MKSLILLSLVLVLTQQQQFEIGTGYYIPNSNLLAQMSGGAQILAEIPDSCISIVKDYKTYSKIILTENTHSFYSYVSSETDLSLDLQSAFTMGFTLTAAYSQTQQKDYQVKGVSFDFAALSQTNTIKQDCISTLELSQDVLNDFNNLQLNIPDPSLTGNWIDYDTFLKKYGSHLTTSIDFGSRLQQWTLAEETSDYTDTQFQIRACLNFEGLESFGKVTASLCENYSKDQKTNSTAYSMQNSIFARGGKTTTRSQIVLNRTAQLVEQFLNEANETLSPIDYRYMSIWDLLKLRYGNDPNSYRRAVNLAAYYNGFLNFSCSKTFDGNTLLQKFALVDESVYQYPIYACTRPVMGCETEDDCHFGSSCVWMCCYCYGDSCIDDASDGRAKIRHDKDGSTYDGPNESCYHKGVFSCGCHTEGYPWEQIWSSKNYMKQDEKDMLVID